MRPQNPQLMNQIALKEWAKKWMHSTVSTEMETVENETETVLG